MSFEGPLPAIYRVTEDNPKPPLLQYGFSVTTDDLVKYAIEEGVEQRHSKDESINRLSIVLTATARLRERSQYNVGMETVRRIEGGRPMVITIYSNYSIACEKLPDEEEESLLDFIACDLDLPEDMKPRWFFCAHAPKYSNRC